MVDQSHADQIAKVCAIFVAEGRKFDANKRIKIEDSKAAHVGGLGDIWIRCGLVRPDQFIREDQVNSTASIGFRIIKKQVKTRGMTVSQSRRFKCQLRGGKVAAPNHDINILRVSNRGLINRGHPCRDRIAIGDRVFDLTFTQDL